MILSLCSEDWETTREDVTDGLLDLLQIITQILISSHQSRAFNGFEPNLRDETMCDQLIGMTIRLGVVRINILLQLLSQTGWSVLIILSIYSITL